MCHLQRDDRDRDKDRDKDNDKKSGQLEKEKKEQDKENLKRKREDEKETREKLRVSNALNRESKKLIQKNTKESKEESKKRKGILSDKNKIRAQYRKDFSSELKRIRGDANISVLQFFDEEENREEQDHHIRLSLINLSSSSSSSSSLSLSPLSSPTNPTSLKNVLEGSESLKAPKGSKKLSTQLPDRHIEKEIRMREIFQSLPTCSKSFFGSLLNDQNNITSPLFSPKKNCYEIENEDMNDNNITENKESTNHNKNFNQNKIEDDNNNNNNNNDNNNNNNEMMNWDDVFQTINCLYTFSDFLQLQISIKINSFVSKIAKITNLNSFTSNSLRNITSTSGPLGNKTNNESKNLMDVVSEINTKNNDNENNTENYVVKNEIKNDVEIENENENDNENGDKEDEWDENDFHTKKSISTTEYNNELKYVTGSNNDNSNDNNDNSDKHQKELLEAHADLDRIHLCLVHALATDLHTLLDLDETDKGSAVKFPLNQVCFITFLNNFELF